MLFIFEGKKAVHHIEGKIKYSVIYQNQGSTKRRKVFSSLLRADGEKRHQLWQFFSLMSPVHENSLGVWTQSIWKTLWIQCLFTIAFWKGKTGKKVYNRERAIAILILVPLTGPSPDSCSWAHVLSSSPRRCPMPRVRCSVLPCDEIWTGPSAPGAPTTPAEGTASLCSAPHHTWKTGQAGSSKCPWLFTGDHELGFRTLE